MSGGSTFSEATTLVPPTTPEQERRAGIILADRVLQDGGTHADLRELLEMTGLWEALR